VKRFRRFLARPVVSVTDAALMATAVLAADAMHLRWDLPWGAVLLIVWGSTIAAVAGTGLLKGLARHWRAGRR
jgi:hypothetical protein